MNQVESFGVLSIGIGLGIGSIATTQGFPGLGLAAVLIVGIGVVVAVFRRYR